jgi:hypothetical protein
MNIGRKLGRGFKNVETSRIYTVYIENKVTHNCDLLKIQNLTTNMQL